VLLLNLNAIFFNFLGAMLGFSETERELAEYFFEKSEFYASELSSSEEDKLTSS